MEQQVQGMAAEVATRPQNQSGGGRSQEGRSGCANRSVVPTRSWRSITREQFLLRETRIVARLRLDGLTDEEILRRAQDENIFQYPTKTSMTGICRPCLVRLNALGDAAPQVTRMLAQGEPRLAAQANLYAMARAHAVVWEFLARLVARKYRTLDYHLSAEDVARFLDELAAQESAVAAWSHSTLVKTRQVLRSLLAKTGHLADVRSEDLLPIAPAYELVDAIRANGDAAILPAYNCMEVA